VNQINTDIENQKMGVDRSRALIHAAQSLEYLRLQFEQLYSSGDSKSPISVDQEINSILLNHLYNFNYSSNSSYSLPDRQSKAIKERASRHEELINKTIEVLAQLDTDYGAEERGYQYIPTPTQSQIDELLTTLPDSSKTELYSYYGNDEDDYYYLENPDNYSKKYAQEFFLRNTFKSSQDTLYLNSVQYFKRIQNEELILIRKLDKGEQSLDFVNYFERTLELNKTMNLWLDSIAIKFDTLREHFTQLEKEYAERAYEAKKHAKDLSTLTEVSVHLLDAFRLGSFAMDSITIADTLSQRIEEIIENKKISYNRLAIQQKIIAKGSHVNKWISREQFRKIMEDSLTQQAYLGLLYQRLSNIKGFEDISPDGVALVSSKLINTIYNMDDLRATLQYKKRLGKTLGFQDYYPFIRTIVDFINIVLETPIGEQSFSEQHRELETFALISDQSLKLFDNISSENYGQSIDNLINIFSYIWDVDVEQATTEQQWAQSLPALKLQGNNKEVAEIEKQFKKTQQEERKELRKGQKNNRKLKKALTVYGKFIANIAMAEDANSVKVALKSVAAPPGSSSVKRNSRVNVSLNSYFGGGFYREQLNLSSLTKEERTSGSVGLSVPVGVTGTVGGLGKNNWSVSLFMPILDLGIFTAYRIDQQNAGQSADLPDLNFGNLIAPGGFLIVNIPKSPFSISGGAQFGPQLRETTVNGTAELTSAWRYGVTATIDVPIFNLFNR